jgi:hypothetical protein
MHGVEFLSSDGGVALMRKEAWEDAVVSVSSVCVRACMSACVCVCVWMTRSVPCRPPPRTHTLAHHHYHKHTLNSGVAVTFTVVLGLFTTTTHTHNRPPPLPQIHTHFGCGRHDQAMYAPPLHRTGGPRLYSCPHHHMPFQHEHQSMHLCVFVCLSM